MSEVVEGQALETRNPEPSRLALVPETTARDLTARLNVIADAMRTAMLEDIDYGRIPGVNKPTLLKPGAEKLGVLFQLDVQIENAMTWHEDGHLTVVSHATVYHAPSGARIASGEAVCTSRESKYAYRMADRVCPACGAPAIIKGKEQFGGGWLCFRKKGGCGAKFGDYDKVITDQETGKVPNPDLPDTYNTVTKMAAKRARVDAILAATGASALFTQDAEDTHQPPPPAQDRPPEREPDPSHAQLVEDVRAGVNRLGPSNKNWTEEAVLASATSSFNRPIAFLEEMTPSELGQILAAMPADTASDAEADDIPFG